MNWFERVMKSFAAGALIGFAGYASLAAQAATGQKIMNSLIFPVGLIMVILFELPLFTGQMTYNCSEKFTIKRFCALAETFFGNYIGAVWVAIIFCCTFNDANILKLWEQVYTAKISTAPLRLFLKGIVCNILISIAVLLAKRETGFAKIFCIAFPTFMFVLIGAEHSVADAFYLIGGNLGVLFWVLLGNIFGGSIVSFFAFNTTW